MGLILECDCAVDVEWYYNCYTEKTHTKCVYWNFGDFSQYVFPGKPNMGGWWINHDWISQMFLEKISYPALFSFHIVHLKCQTFFYKHYQDKII